MNKQLIKKEAIAGVTTFFTMAYIVVVNPSILSTPGTGLVASGVLTATVLLCFSMTLLMGLYAKLPFAVAPGMGINAFFTFYLILGKQIPWQTALGIVFWAGVLFLLISVTSVRTAISKAIPHHLRIASATGIGMFLTFIGLKNAGMIVADPVTFVKFGKIDFTVFLSIVGILSITVLQRKKNPFSFLVVIAGITLVAFMTGRVVAPTQWLSQPDFESVFFKLDPISALKWSLVPAIFSLMMTDLFDSISTFVGVSQAGGLLDKNGEPKNLKQGLIVDAWATLTAGLFGTSSGTAYIESASGIEAGGRTGLTSVFTALCFLPCFFIGPLVSMVPAYATAPVLIFVGALLFKTVFELKTQKPEDLIPVFLTVTLIPLSFSITQGILWGFISHIILYTFYGRHKELSKTMITIGIMSAIMIWIENT